MLFDIQLGKKGFNKTYHPNIPPPIKPIVLFYWPRPFFLSSQWIFLALVSQNSLTNSLFKSLLDFLLTMQTCLEGHLGQQLPKDVYSACDLKEYYAVKISEKTVYLWHDYSISYSKRELHNALYIYNLHSFVGYYPKRTITYFGVIHKPCGHGWGEGGLPNVHITT